MTFTEGTASIARGSGMTFSKDPALEQIVLPSTLKTINSANAFAGLTSLKSINLPAGLKIDNNSSNLFKGCTSLTQIDLPEGFDSIPMGMFNSCTSLKR